MIDTNKLDKISYTNKIVKMYEELNTELVKDIIFKIENSKVDITFTKAQIRVLAKRGGYEIYKNVIKKSNKLSFERKKYLLELFEKTIKEDLVNYKELYEYRDKELKLSEQQYNILKKMTQLTNKELKNFTRTMAFSSQKEFVNAIDDMYKQVVTGGTDFQSAFESVSNNLAKKGITLPMKNGVNRSIESAVRQSVLYGIRQTSQLVENDLIKELDADGVQINITPNCRPSHQAINGKVFSLDKNNKKYPYFSKQYKSLMEEYGCQHYASPFIIGVSEEIYTKQEIKEANNRTVNFNGEEIPYYEATQKQRALERNIRNAKKEYMSKPNTENKAKINRAEEKIKKFTKEVGLERDTDREYFAGYNK